MLQINTTSRMSVLLLLQSLHQPPLFLPADLYAVPGTKYDVFQTAARNVTLTSQHIYMHACRHHAGLPAGWPRLAP